VRRFFSKKLFFNPRQNFGEKRGGLEEPNFFFAYLNPEARGGGGKVGGVKGFKKKTFLNGAGPQRKK